MIDAAQIAGVALKTPPKSPTRGTLADREPHPASLGALAWIRAKTPAELSVYQEAFASCAIDGNRLAEICSETLNRLLSGQSVSDRYLLGLAWVMRTNK